MLGHPGPRPERAAALLRTIGGLKRLADYHPMDFDPNAACAPAPRGGRSQTLAVIRASSHVDRPAVLCPEDDAPPHRNRSARRTNSSEQRGVLAAAV